MDWVTRPAPLNDRFRRHHPRLHAGAVQHAALLPGHVRRYRQRAGMQRGPSAAPDRMKRHAYVLAFNLGRIRCLRVFGLLAGTTGGVLFDNLDPTLWRRVASAVAGLSLILTGLYPVAGSMRYAGSISSADTVAPHRTDWTASVAGTYAGSSVRRRSGLGLAAVRAGILFLCTGRAAGDAMTGALFMLAFGLGTIPGCRRPAFSVA